ncbi:MAG: patatin-like phospholipase family protein [Sphaerochaetaceae bacterium]|jgi:NTE family protein
MTGGLKKLVVFVLIAVCTASLFSAPFASDGGVITNASNDLLAAVVPITYGDEAFRQRILESTGAQREPIGLVLSGGSARAFAHIGVLKYMEENGIVPDFIISNSMGSIIGLMYAAGLSPDQILEICSNVPLGTLFDLTIPFEGGLLDPTKFKAVLKTYLGDNLRLEELPIPVMVICEDLATKRQVHIMEGDFFEVMNAAYALPVYYPPVEYKGHLLIDGGMSNLVPLDLAYQYADFNIVSTTFYDVTTLNLRNPLTVLNTSFDIGKRRQGVTELLEHKDDAIWIRCDVESTSFMEFSAAVELADKGYASAAEHAQEFLAISGKHPVSPELQAIRDAYAPQLVSAQYFYNLYGHAYQREFSQFLGLGVKSYRYPGDDYYLRDDILFGPEYGLRWDNLEVSVIGGAAWQSYSSDYIDKIFPSLAFSIDYYLLNFVKLSIDATAAWDRDTWFPTGYFRQAFELKFRQFDKRLNLTLIETYETVINPKRTTSGSGGTSEPGESTEMKSSKYMLLSAGFRGYWTQNEDSPLGIGFGTGYQLAGWFDKPRHFVYDKLNFDLPLPFDFTFGANFSARFSVDGKGQVPFFVEDGFRTNATEIRMQGKPDASWNIADSDAPYLLVGSFSFDWTPAVFKPSFGEFLLFENSSIGIYCDLLWNTIGDGAFVPKVSTGVALHTDMALIGLQQLPMSVYVGYDQPANSVIWGIWFGVMD